jgi:DNA-binding CsgD family transcriptional regulator
VNGRPRQLYERDVELAAIEDALRETESGTVTLIRGTAGAGKTRLVNEAVDRARHRGLRTLTASGGELEQDLPYGIARQLFELPLAKMDEAEQATLLEGPAGLAAPALGLELDAARQPGQDTSFAVMHGLYWLTANMAGSDPLAIAVDDAHWADMQSLRWLRYLVRRLEGLPVTLVVAARPHDVPRTAELIDALASGPPARVLEPRPLSRNGVEALLASSLDGAVHEEFAAACHEATGGNPFLVHELVRGIEAQGLAPAAESAANIREMSPDAVSRAVLSRLAGLGDRPSSLARAAAILFEGAEFHHAALLAGLDPAPAAQAADRLTATAILRGSRPLEFVHPVVRQAIYDTITPAQRALDHGRAARMLAQEDRDIDTVAAHLLLTEPTADAWVAGTLVEAAELALSRGAPDAALAYLRRALEEPPAAEERARVLRGLGTAEAVTNSGGAVDHLREALELTEKATDRAPIVLALGQALVLTGRPEEAIGLYDEVIASLPPQEREMILRLESELFVAGYVGLEARELVVGRPLEVANDPPADPSPGERLALAAAASEAVIAAGSRASDVCAVAQHALGGGELLSQQTADSPTFYLAANAVFYCDELELAARVYGDAADDARTRGSLRASVMTAAWLAGIEYRLGQLAEAESHARLWFETPEHQVPIAAPLSVGFLVEALIDRGRADEAAEVLEAVGLVGELPDFVHVNMLLAARGRLRLELGDLDRGIEDLIECGRREAAWKVGTPGIAMWRHLLALALADREPDRARHLAAEELERARSFGAPRALAVALRGAGLLRHDEEGLGLLRESAEKLEGTGFRLEHARSLAELGVRLRHAGRRNEAQATLRAAVDQASRCGAKPLVARAIEELRLAGARPRRERLTGLESLTPAETRVARLAGEGMTNREIAQALFVTVKTVEMHLSRVYRKLDVASRDQLDRALA